MSTAVMPTYGRVDIAFESGEGPYLIATDGRRYLDFCAGIAVNALGHGHPKVVEAVKAQAEKLWHTSNLYRIPEQERLADNLVASSFADLAFFCNSGAEAVEGGLKLCRKYQSATGNDDRWRIITTTGSFHGRTIATLAAAKNPKHLDGFGPPADGFDQVPFGNTNELRAAVTEETAAIVVEPIQGEGGIHPATPEYLQALRNVADEYGLLLFYDEVQCGVGRSGKMWAHEWSGVAPDVMAVAKGIAGGFPMGVVMATEAAAQGMTAGTHGSTFGGNQLACAAANAVVEEIASPGFLDRVVEIGGYFMAKLEELVAARGDVFGSAHGVGLMLGVTCKVPNLELMTKTREAGLLTVIAADDFLRFLPPLTIEESHVDEAIAVLDEVAANWGKDG